jgi:hypothetical protein
MVLSNLAIFFCRHIKGRVLAALADGTVAVFHRAEGMLSYWFT